MTVARGLAAGLPLLLTCAAILARSYRLTAINTGFVLSYGAWSRSLTLLACLGSLVAGLSLRGKVQWFARLSALLVLFVAWQLWRHELVIDARGVRATSLWSSRGIAWNEIEQDRSDDRVLRLVSGGTSLTLDTSRMAPRDAATVRRTIARRIEGAGQRPAPAPPTR